MSAELGNIPAQVVERPSDGQAPVGSNLDALSPLHNAVALQTDGYKPVNGEVLDVDKHMLFARAGVTTNDSNGNKIVVPLNAFSLWERELPPFRRVIGIDTEGKPITTAASLIDLNEVLPHLLPGEEPITLKYIPLEEPRRISSDEGIRILTHVHDRPELEPGENGYPHAGGVLPENAHIQELKLYETEFGRDFLFATLMTDNIYPKLTETGVIRLIQLQGLEFNVSREEEFGKIMHENRRPDDPQAKIIKEKVGWEFPYYGAIDSTPLWVQAVWKVQQRYQAREADFLDVVVDIPSRNGIPEHNRSVDESVRMGLSWITQRLDKSPNGLFENKRIHPKGIENQVWTDSPDPLFHKDGSLPDPESHLAHFEAQVYIYDALLDGYEMYKKRDPEFADGLKARADNLRTQIMKKFWVEDERGGYFAPGIEIVKTDGESDELRPFEIRRSNMGHAFRSRLLHGEDKETRYKREATFRALHAPELMCARGIRTLSNREKRFGEERYHNGNVWTWENAWIAIGFREHGYLYAARELMHTITTDIHTLGRFTEHQKGNDAEKPELNERYVVVYNLFDQRENVSEQPGQELQFFTVEGIRRCEDELADLVNISSIPTPVERELGFAPDLAA